MQAETQHAVITGGTGTLGREIAKAMQAPNWSIDALGTSDFDLRDGSAIRQYFSNRRTDLLVCAAGITADARLPNLSPAAWDETWQVNYHAAADCAAAVLPGMIERRNGHIVFISSYSALHPPVGQVAYAAAKAALLGLVAELASRYGRFNVRVNAILPGFLETRMTASVSETRRTTVQAEHTLGRFNTCHEAARFIRFLHHELPHTSGQIFQLDSRTNFPRFSEQ